MTAGSVVRGCGTRQPGGAYLVTSLSERGTPLEQLIIDPPRPVDAARLGLSPQGMALALTENAVLDWVGLEAYPNVADYVEEVSLFGSSRRVPTTFNFGVLGPGSRHVLLHPRALVKNFRWPLDNRAPQPWAERQSFLYRALQRTGRTQCPFDLTHEVALGLELWEFCASLWWEVLMPGSVTFADDLSEFDSQCQRVASVGRIMPAFSYAGYTLPDRDVWTPEWGLGAFLSLPISKIEIVRDPDDLTHEIALSRASRSSLPVEVVDE